MNMSTFLIFVVMFAVIGFLAATLFSAPSRSRNILTRKPGLYTNRKGKGYRVTRRGYLERTGTLADFVNDPTIQRQLQGIERLYKRQVLKALWYGDRPPHKVGELMEMTKDRLQIEWNDEWQEALDELSGYMGISYNKLFDIEEEPEVAELTAQEIASQYVEKERTSKSAIRRYVSSGGSLRL